MTAAERLKGRRAEADVARLLRAAGFTVRGLESGGDHHAVRGELRLHVEVKRQERGWRWAWARQAVADAQDGSVPVVIWRRNREPWQLTTREDDWTLGDVVTFYRKGDALPAYDREGATWLCVEFARWLLLVDVPS